MANALVAAVMSRRLAAGLLVETDRETPELTSAIGRFRYWAKDAVDRDAFVAREAAAGRNPAIVAAGEVA